MISYSSFFSRSISSGEKSVPLRFKRQPIWWGMSAAWSRRARPFSVSAANEQPFIFLLAVAADQTLGFELLQYRRQRTGIEEQTLAQVMHRDFFFFPKDHHRNILGVRNTQLLEHRVIGRHNFTGAGIEGKTKLGFVIIKDRIFS